MAKHVADTDTARKTPNRREQAGVAWAGLALTGVGLAGLLIAPQARLVWIALIVFGVATIPQVLVWCLGGRRS